MRVCRVAETMEEYGMAEQVFDLDSIIDRSNTGSGCSGGNISSFLILVSRIPGSAGRLLSRSKPLP